MSFVSRYRAASEQNDMAVLLDCLTDDARLESPLSGRMVFRGKDDLGVLLGAVYGGLTGLRWYEELGDSSRRVLIGETRVAGIRMTDAMVLDLAEDGRIERIRPHLRPWLALTAFALRLGPQIARHPGVIVRALRAKG